VHGRLSRIYGMEQWLKRKPGNIATSLMTLNEFYKKGCQAKTSPSTGDRVICLDIQPTVCASAPAIRPGGFALDGFPFRWFLCRWRQCQSSLRDLASESAV
jgi:hypothetical protein